MNKKHVTISISVDLWKTAKRWSVDNDTNFSAMIESALEYYMTNHDELRGDVLDDEFSIGGLWNGDNDEL